MPPLCKTYGITAGYINVVEHLYIDECQRGLL